MRKVLFIFLLIVATATLANAQFLPKFVIETTFKKVRPALIKNAAVIKDRQKKLLMKEYRFKEKQADTTAAIQYNLTLFFNDSLYTLAKTKEDRAAIYDTALAHYYIDLKNALQSDDLVAKVKEDDDRRSLTQDYWMSNNVGTKLFYSYLWVHHIKRKMLSLNQYDNRYDDGPANF